ncbi:MAG: serpin family protein [Polyangia bacterium]|jgi:serpin B
MTRWIRPGTGSCVLSALFFAAFAGCGSSNSKSAPDATTHDTALSQDVVVALDGFSDHAVAPDAAASDSTVAPDAAQSDALVADVPATDAASSDAESVSDAGSAPDIVTAMSSVQRIADPQVPAADITTLASDNAAFAFAAYQQLITTNTNLVFSPASISIALAMTYAGAATTTATEMAQVLHFTLPPAQLHPAFNALDQTLASRGQGFLGGDGGPMQVDIVNALWAEQTYTFRSDFLDTLAENYGAGVNLLDFINAPDPSRLTINAWVAGQTNDKIQNLLPPGSIGSATKLVLTDAVYFNAAWSTPFDPNNTQDGPFTRLDGSTVTVSFMNAYLPGLPAIQGTSFVAASLPYADTRLSLVVVVPDEGQFSQVESSLNATTLATLVAGLVSQPVILTLPRFKVETATSLKLLLQALGMISAFIPRVADFSGMDGTLTLFISNVFHDAFIDVAEKGTEAAAATAVVVAKDSVASAPPTGLVVDATRPFIYFLYDQPTGAILFMGRVQDPNQN